MKSHQWVPISPKNPFYCAYCGLIRLNNDISRKLASKPCPGKDYDKEDKR